MFFIVMLSVLFYIFSIISTFTFIISNLIGILNFVPWLYYLVDNTFTP